MNRRLALLVCVVAATGLTGCNDYTTPQGIVGTAYNALKNDKVKTLKRSLTGDALARYGNTAGMVELQKRFAGRELRAGATVLVGVERNARGWDKSRFYAVDVMSRAAGRADDEFTRETRADVYCSVTFERRRDRDFPRDYPGHYHPGRPGGWYPLTADVAVRNGNPNPRWFDEYTRCWIRSLD